MEKEFLQHSSKMGKTMENLANAMSGCLQLMTAMFHTQMQNPNVAFSSVPPFMQMPNDKKDISKQGEEDIRHKRYKHMMRNH